MNQQAPKRISRRNPGAAFETEEAHKSKLILEAQLLRESQPDEAARIEERLSEICDDRGLTEKALLHRFSAVSCRSQAGNFYQAIALSDELPGRPELSDRLRQRVLTLCSHSASSARTILRRTDTGLTRFTPGNHDLELALPRTRERLLEILAGDDAGRARTHHARFRWRRRFIS